MEDFISSFRPFLTRNQVTIDNLNVAHNDEYDEEEEEIEISSDDDDDENDDLSNDVIMTTKEADLIVEMAHSLIDSKLDNPRIIRAIQLYNTKIVQERHFELQMGKFRKFCFRLSKNWVFNYFILFVVLINVTSTIVRTSKSVDDTLTFYISGIDQCCLAVYIFEAIIKLIAEHETYFFDAWNDFDFTIVILSFIDYFSAWFSTSTNFNPSIIRIFRIFKTLRALRAVKLLKTIPSFQSMLTLLDSIASSFVDCISSMFLLLIIMYFYAFIGLTFYKEVSPNQFGDFSRAFFSMFQLCTLDDWFDVYDSVKEIPEGNILFFITFILIGSFIIMNYITAVLTDNACSAAVRYSENASWIRRLQKQHQTLKENEELMKSKHSPSAKKNVVISDSYPEMGQSRLEDISQILAILGEIERIQMVSDGHKAVFYELVDQALKAED